MKKPKVLTSIEELLKLAPLEERVYRMRCVEGWSMVIPWVGYSAGELIKRVEPTGNAKFVEFITLNDPDADAGTATMRVLRVALRRGPAHGRSHAPADAARARAVRRSAAESERRAGARGGALEVRVQERQVDRARSVSPSSSRRPSWELAKPSEYGFYSNVNPQVDHPRWSQAKERRIGEFGKRPTLMFNGYADQVASLYAGHGSEEELLTEPRRRRERGERVRPMLSWPGTDLRTAARYLSGFRLGFFRVSASPR